MSDSGLLGARRFRTLLGIVGVAFTLEGVLQPVIPLLIVSLGGNAAIIGAVSACFALPSLPLRPLIGRAVDRGALSGVYRVATITLLASQILFLIPVLAITLVARTAQGVAWAGMSTTNNVVMARLAPPQRRAEASSYYNMMVGVGYFVGAPIGVAAFTVLGPSAPFLLTVGLAIGLIEITRRVARSVPTPPVEGSTAGRSLFERSAILSMVMISTFAATQSLFMAFAPLYAATVGGSPEQLILHYAVYGGVLIVALPLVGRLSDRIGRRRGLLIGCALGAASVGPPILAPSMGAFTTGSALYGLAFAVVTPAAVAVAIDRSPAGRLGSTVATYSLGYQAANGLGGALWGGLITIFGFPSPSFVAGLLIGATAIVSWPATNKGGTQWTRG